MAEVEQSVPKYSNKQINNHTVAFNLESKDDRPNIRNVKYKSSNDHLCCLICQQPFVEPMTTVCGHTFCKECIYEFLKVQNQRRRVRRGDRFEGDNANDAEVEDEEQDNESDRLIGSCPLDRTPLDSSKINELFPTPLIISNLVDELEVYCLNHERGCEWTGCRWEIEHHVLSDCGYTGVTCNGHRAVHKEGEQETEICKLLVERRFLDDENEANEQNGEDTNSESDFGDHQASTRRRENDIGKARRKAEAEEEDTADDDDESKDDEKTCKSDENNIHECIHKILHCDLCQKQITKISQRKHLEEDCLFNYASCNLCSNNFIPKMNLAKHEENCSKMGHLKCPAHEIGCDWVGASETSLEIHLQNNNCQLSKLLPYMQTLNKKVDNLSKENSLLHRQINKILNSIIQGKITNLGYHEPMEEINKFSSELSSVNNQDKLLFLNFELNRLKFELDEKILPYINRESTSQKERESILNGLVNENFMMKDDLNLQRALVNSLRKQLQFMLFTRNAGGAQGGFFRGSGAAAANFAAAGEHESNDFFDIPSRSNSEERLNLKL